MKRDKLNSLIKSLVEEIVEDDDLEEATTTGDVAGYNTPMAFADDSDSSKKKNKKISTNSTGYKVVNEELDNKDLARVKLLIKDQVAKIILNIWLKRSSWKNAQEKINVNTTTIWGKRKFGKSVELTLEAAQ